MGEYLLVCWDADNSVSVIGSKSKGMISYVDDRVSYRWGKKGVFEGTVHFASDSKREVERKAKEMTRKVDSDDNSEAGDQMDKTGKAKAAGKVKQRKRKCIDTNDDKKHSHSVKKANMSVHHAAAKEIFENEEIKRLREEIEQLKKVREPQNPLGAKASKDIPVTDPVYTSEFDGNYQIDTISPYEAAMIKRREENKELIRKLGLNKEMNTPKTSKSVKRDSTSEFNGDSGEKSAEDKREKIPIQRVELVKNMGILIKSSSLAAALRRCNRQPTRLLRLLMMELFTEDELRTSSMRGKKGPLPGLDQDTVNAILCYTMAKAEEWGNPIREEALVRQGNEKCYQHRRHLKN